MEDKALSIFFLFISIVYLIFAQGLSFGTMAAPKSGFIPNIAGVTATVLATINVANNFRAKAVNNTGVNWTQLIFTIIGLLVYLLSISLIGYFWATFVIIIYLLKVTGIMGWLIPFAISAGITAVFYVLFEQILMINLP